MVDFKLNKILLVLSIADEKELSPVENVFYRTVSE